MGVLIQNNRVLFYLIRSAITRIIYFFSDVDREIMYELPSADRRPYLQVGLLNIAVVFISTAAIYGFSNISHKPYVSSGIAMTYLVLIIFGCRYKSSRIMRESPFKKNPLGMSIFFLCYFFLNYLAAECLIAGLTYNAQPRSTLIMELTYGSGELKFTYLFNWVTYNLAIFFSGGPIVSSLTILFFIILFYLELLTVNRSRNDLYRALIQEKEQSKVVALDKEREEVLQKFKLRSEIEQTKKILGDISHKEPDGSASGILSNLQSVDDPKTLEAFADYLLTRQDYERAGIIFDKAIILDPENPGLWKKKAEVLGLAGNYKESQDAQKKYTDLVKQSDFIENISRKVILDRVTLHGISFYGDFEWQFRPGINVLLGRNGYGKSHLLSILLAILQEEEKKLVEFHLLDGIPGETQGPVNPSITLKIVIDTTFNQKEIARLGELLKTREAELSQIGRDRIASSAAVDMVPLTNDILHLNDQIEALKGRFMYSKLGIQSTIGKIPLLAIPDLRFINKSTDYTLPAPDERSKKLLEYGAYHFIEQAPYEQAIQNFLNGLSNIYLDKKNFDDEIFKLVNRIFRRLTGAAFEWKEIRRTEDNSGFIIKVRTEGNTQDLPIQKVSQGTLSILSVVGIIFHFLSLRFPRIPRTLLCKQHSIVFIDELDAHLHPSWQQKIVGILRTEFPNIQFIISAHSPLLVAGCKEGEVSVLRRKDEGFKIETIDQNLIGVPIADIFRFVFDIEEKDEAYLQLAALLPFKSKIENRLKELSNKEKRTPEEEEEWQELRMQAEDFVYLDQYKTLRSSKDEVEELRQSFEMEKLKSIQLEAKLSRDEFSNKY